MGEVPFRLRPRGAPTTLLGVAALGLPGHLVEIEATAVLD